MEWNEWVGGLDRILGDIERTKLGPNKEEIIECIYICICICQIVNDCV